jgi:hypothetical protein
VKRALRNQGVGQIEVGVRRCSQDGLHRFTLFELQDRHEQQLAERLDKICAWNLVRRFQHPNRLKQHEERNVERLALLLSGRKQLANVFSLCAVIVDEEAHQHIGINRFHAVRLVRCWIAASISAGVSVV